MTIAAAKQVVAAGNLANVNTPGYHARAVDFTAALERQMGGTLSLTGTSGGHLEGTVSEAVSSQEVGAWRRAATATTCSSIASC